MDALYTRLGGDAAVDKAVDLFYDKVLADQRIKHFFENMDVPRLRRMQKRFLTMAFGGENAYVGRGMREAHKNLSLTDEHFDIVVELLGKTLVELGVGEGEIQEIAAIANSIRDDVLNK